MSKLANKVLVVIGGTTGIGFSAAQAFVEAGAKVILVGRNEDNVKTAQKALGKSARAITGDATDSKTAAKAIQAALATLGGFHGLYHVAGGSGRHQDAAGLESIDAGESERGIASVEAK